jgi:glycosyltransferase involved in cell wall biosynthesis
VDGKKMMNVLFLSTYPPRACGIATFTQDLVRALNKTGKIETGIVAISDGDYDYPTEVRFSLNQQDANDYPAVAERINTSGADQLMIEHEFGIYGGKAGAYLLKLTPFLKIPYSVTLHTVLPKPTKKQKEIISSLAKGCRKMVTMSTFSVKILQDVYGVPKEKIVVANHGVPELPLGSRDALKKEEKLTGRFVVSTFGLLSPGKGLEYGIGAIALAAKKRPEIIYLILGQTHPVIKARFGEKYREKLIKTAEDLGISENVRFVNRYLTKEEIIRYLSLSDVYMTPYLGKDQAVSGTLAYAVGYGKVIVSTPYPYAQEMLADGRGLLAKFRSSVSLSKCILKVMDHPELQAEMERKTLTFGKNMMWSRVAERYLSIFRDVTAHTEGAFND